eukprot:4127814-Amphidinium_carterae.1
MLEFFTGMCFFRVVVGMREELVQAILWMSPLTASLVLFLLSAMVMFNLHLHRRLAVNLEEEDEDDGEEKAWKGTLPPNTHA